MVLQKAKDNDEGLGMPSITVLFAFKNLLKVPSFILRVVACMSGWMWFKNWSQIQLMWSKIGHKFNGRGQKLVTNYSLCEFWWPGYAELSQAPSESGTTNVHL